MSRRWMVEHWQGARRRPSQGVGFGVFQEYFIECTVLKEMK